MNSKIFSTLALCVALPILGGCAADRHYREGNERLEQGRLEESLEEFRSALSIEPNSARYRAAYLNARDRSLARMLDQALAAEKDNRPDDARQFYTRMLAIDDGNARARAGIAALDRQSRHAERMRQAKFDFAQGNLDSAETGVRAVLTENANHVEALALKTQLEEERARPKLAMEARLAEAFRTPISIEFRDAQLRQVFEVLSRTSGLNFVLDKDVRGEQKTTIFLRNSSVSEALTLTLLTNQLEQRVLNSNSVLIFPNTAAKLREYEPLSVKTFVLNTGEAKSVANTLKTVLKTRDVVIDEKQNILIVRDSPDALRMAEKLIAVHDQPGPEVMLDVEILEVKRSKLLELGIQYPAQLSLTPLPSASGGSLRLSDLQHLSSSTIGASISPLTINANNTLSDINVLANPRIRAGNREKAKIQVGQRLPNITSTSTATGFVAETVQYVDVGLKLEVESTVSTDDEVAIKIALEVSNITDKLTTKNGSTAYEIGTRNTSTVLRLRDGENQILAGLINNEERSGANQIPGFGSIPLLGRLFGSTRDESLKSEIVLSITPHIIRSARRPQSSIAEFDTGTEASLHTRLDSILPPLAKTRAPTPASRNDGARPATPSAATPERATRPEASAADKSPTATPEKPVGAKSLVWSGPGDTSVGNTVNVTLIASTDEAVTSVPFVISYDPKLLELVSVEQGDFMSSKGDPATFSSRVDRDKGIIRGVVNSTSNQGAAGQGALANLVFRPLARSEDTRLSISDPIVASGPGGKAVEIRLPDAKVLRIK